MHKASAGQVRLFIMLDFRQCATAKVKAKSRLTDSRDSNHAPRQECRSSEEHSQDNNVPQEGVRVGESSREKPGGGGNLAIRHGRTICTSASHRSLSPLGLGPSPDLVHPKRRLNPLTDSHTLGLQSRPVPAPPKG